MKECPGSSMIRPINGSSVQPALCAATHFRERKQLLHPRVNDSLCMNCLSQVMDPLSLGSLCDRSLHARF